jgi:hypothetical protein
MKKSVILTDIAKELERAKDGSDYGKRKTVDILRS